MDWIRILIRCFQADAVLYTSHARREMQTEGEDDEMHCLP